jgi:hypothetical protein
VSKFIQIVAAAIPQVDGAHPAEFSLHALDDDGRVWVYNKDRIEHMENGSPVYDENDRAKRLPPRWERLTDEREGESMGDT